MDTVKITKRKPAKPKVKYLGKTYTIEERAGDTIRIKGDSEFCIHKDNVEPANREAKDLLK